MNWLLIVILAYFLNALAMVIDKKLLSRSIPDPLVYTFYIGVLSIIFIPVLLFFKVVVPEFLILLSALVAGVFFVLALLLMYRALIKEEASRVAPFIGSLSPIFIFLLAIFFLNESLTYQELAAFLLVFAGGILVSLNFNKSQVFPLKSLRLAILSSFFFASSYALTKYIYNNINFASGFFWIRIGTIIGAAALLAIPGAWNKIKNNFKKNKEKISSLFFAGQFFGGVSALLLSFSISLAPVTLVNSLQGLQYGFLFLSIYFLSTYRPKFLKEKFTTAIVLQKTLAIALISAGLFILSRNI